ncbi:DUF389 domain-containing protein [Flavobacterium tibetense]|jgi:uncharacterized hydrophobic protein (TIGR00271 family)|uniref:TIGR00341 family protein n=1 Tax=Flavobacterium tibetense TaxID=2233533 RepID=A0A365P0C8_9FLAO|nr:DUF389 domain-containing protein [Flavobacterium tibetense]RBA27966.1 hypothetical protein DPN68_09760 [Flavobacterium tibetense]
MENNKGTFKEVVLSVKRFLGEIFNISEDTDVQATILDVKAGIPIKGQTAWVLIFSILIASAGLNTSSPAVVIGAMLISPLMGPIMGVGLSLGINDIYLLRKALKNFGIMVALSIATSFLYFSIPVFQHETPELIARTGPDVRDVIIAFAGGLALIIAFSRRAKQYTTIAGVAIATALMPPLCTAGYGLATAKWEFFGGAIFLFSINTIFIASATFLIVRFLKFPMEEYLDSKREKFISNIVYIASFIILIPSIFFFYKLYKKTEYEQTISTFIEKQKETKGVLIFDIDKDYNKNEVSFAVIGNKISQADLDSLKTALNKKGYSDVKINILKDYHEGETLKKLNEIEKVYMASQQIMEDKFPILNSFDQIVNEVKVLNSDIESISYGRILKSNFSKTDTIPTFFVKWKANITSEMTIEKKKTLENWLRVKTNNNNVLVKIEE